MSSKLLFTTCSWPICSKDKRFLMHWKKLPILLNFESRTKIVLVHVFEWLRMCVWLSFLLSGKLLSKLSLSKESYEIFCLNSKNMLIWLSSYWQCVGVPCSYDFWVIHAISFNSCPFLKGIMQITWEKILFLAFHIWLEY